MTTRRIAGDPVPLIDDEILHDAVGEILEPLRDLDRRVLAAAILLAQQLVRMFAHRRKQLGIERARVLERLRRRRVAVGIGLRLGGDRLVPVNLRPVRVARGRRKIGGRHDGQDARWRAQRSDSCESRRKRALALQRVRRSLLRCTSSGPRGGTSRRTSANPSAARDDRRCSRCVAYRERSFRDGRGTSAAPSGRHRSSRRTETRASRRPRTWDLRTRAGAVSRPRRDAGRCTAGRRAASRRSRSA